MLHAMECQNFDVFSNFHYQLDGMVDVCLDQSLIVSKAVRIASFRIDASSKLGVLSKLVRAERGVLSEPHARAVASRINTNYYATANLSFADAKTILEAFVDEYVRVYNEKHGEEDAVYVQQHKSFIAAARCLLDAVSGLPPK